MVKASMYVLDIHRAWTSPIRAGILLFSIIQCIFFRVADPDSNPYVFGPPRSGSGAMNPDPDLSIINKNSEKNLDSYCFLLLFDLLFLKNDGKCNLKSN